MARSAVSLKDAARRGASGPPKHERRRLPAEHAVLWTPRGKATGASDAGRSAAPYEVLIERGVIAGMNRHLVAAEREPRFGFLLGKVFRCPESGAHFCVADTAVAAGEVLAEEASGAYLIRAWTEAQAVFRDHSGVLLGWYHSHHRYGLMLSDSDEDTNARYFSEPWQFSIIVVPSVNRPLGGVFRAEPGASAEERRRPAPFFELIGAPADPTRPTVPSAVVWTNYDPDRGVRVAAEHAGTEATVRTPAGGAGREGSDPVRVVMPGSGIGGLLPPRRRRMMWPAAVFGMVMVVVALLVVAGGIDTSPPTSVPRGLTARTPAQRAFLADVDALGVAADRYRERAGDFDAGRIGCEFLTTGYAAADESFMRIASSYGALGDEPNREATDAYEMAIGEISAVNAHFDGSGCTRP